MRKSRPEDAYVDAKVVGGRLVISVGIDTLAYAFEVGAEYAGTPFKVNDKKAFAKEVIRELLNEDPNTGLTPIHQILDAACDGAIENGTEFADEIKG